MAITVSEKTHWRDRIAKRIDHRVETLVAKEDPTLLQRTEKEAREKAYESLGILSQRDELEALEKQKEDIEKRERRLHAEQRAILNGTKVEDELEHGSYRYDKTVENAVGMRAKVHEAELLAEDEVGKQILSLRAEKENLLDTVWLATSPSQIKELWEQVNTLLSIVPTELEQKALAISPPQAE